MGYIVVKKPGEQAIIREYGGKEIAYQTLRDAVEGFIERVVVGDGHRKDRVIDMWVNEEGKLNGMKPNLDMGFDIVVGPVLFCYGTRHGKSVPFPEEHMAQQLVAQIMKFHIEDPDSVDVPEPEITFHTIDGE